MKRCFVISPIGDEGTDIRNNADKVFKYIISPALEACDIKAVRSDHLNTTGRISEQMYTELYNDDLCIADLTGRNPNVFYELALAQGANRPVIILVQKGERLPFDVSDLRCIYYDFETEALMEKVYVNKVIDYIKQFEASNWKTPDHFSRYRLNTNVDTKELEFFKTSGDLNPMEWLEALEDTNRGFDIMGV